MEPIIEKVKHPSAPLRLCAQPPIGSAEKTALLTELDQKPAFQGAWTIAEGGLPVVMLHALDARHYRAARTSMTGVLAWLWNHRFGRLVSFSLVVPDKRIPRAFFADDSVIVRAVSERGKIAFAVAHGKATTPFYLADFNAHPEHADMLDAFRALLRFEDNPNFAFRDDELAFWSLMAWNTSKWHDDLPNKDAARARWAIVYEGQIEVLQKTLEHARSRNGSDPYATDDARKNLPAAMPFLDEMARLVIQPSATVSKVIEAVSVSLDDPVKLGDLVQGLSTAAKKGAFPDELRFFLWDAIVAGLLSPRSTKCGLRRPWLDGRVGSGDVAVRYLDLEFAALGEGARNYWSMFDESELTDMGYVVTGRDRPIERKELFRGLAELKLDCTEEEADLAIRELLNEAREGRQWSAPWGARVQINVGPLKYLDIHELEGEFMGVFRNKDDHFLLLSVNIMTGNYSVPRILRSQEGEIRADDNIEARLALALVTASVVRDFLVVEERSSLFDTTRAKSSRCQTNRELSVIYLPRVRYISPNVKLLLDDAEKKGRRVAHSVAAHLRRADKAGSAQLLLAMRYGLTVRQGYTFVRPHRRGNSVEEQRVRVYRSRSASRILYDEVVRAPRGTRPAWFDFEKDVALIMSSLGLIVVHQAASGVGDGGVDIYAHDEAMDNIWAIQCKCYSPSKKVGPDVVRALAGSLHRYPDGTRGMIVTTSSLTPGALREADELKIDVIDGQRFAALVEAHSSCGQSA